MSLPLSRPPVLVESLADVASGALAARLAASLDRADLVELRLDRLPSGVLSEIAPALRPRLLVTCRAAWEGGAWQGSEDARRDVLLGALDAGVAYVDVEWRADFRDDLLRRDAGRTVVSWHDFAGVPADLTATLGAMLEARPALAKVAVTATSLRDLLALRAAAVVAGARPVALIAMGAAGTISRLVPARIGSHWTYAGDGVAPGQVPASVMREVYRVGAVSPGAALYGVAGRPIGHSLSPVLHNAALAARAVDAMYVPCAAADIDDLLEVAEALDIRGLSVTAPFKHDALARASVADDAARAVGAANTLTRTREGWAATNTDVEGFLAPLRARRALRGLRVAVIGAGGAARAVVAGLAAEGAHVAVHARRRAQGESLTALGASAVDGPPRAGTWDILVNTTPVGTAPDVDATPLPAPQLGTRLGGRLVYDLVYNPARTRLLADAAALGAEVLGGLDMLVAQAARQFSIWHGGPPPVDTMRAAVARHAAHLVPTAEAACPE